MLYKKHGFTLIEMLVVLAIMGVLTMMAIPTNAPLKMRQQVNEVLDYIEPLKKNVEATYKLNGFSFPETNKLAGLPDADKLISKQITSVELLDGAFHIQLGNNVYPALEGKIISVQPLVVIDSPSNPIDWQCGLAKAPAGMQIVGHNKTDIPLVMLPNACRGAVKN